MIGSSTMRARRIYAYPEAGFEIWVQINVTCLDHHFGFNLIKGKFFQLGTHSNRSDASLVGRWVIEAPQHCKCHTHIWHFSSNSTVLSNQYSKTVELLMNTSPMLVSLLENFVFVWKCSTWSSRSMPQITRALVAVSTLKKWASSFLRATNETVCPRFQVWDENTSHLYSRWVQDLSWAIYLASSRTIEFDSFLLAPELLFWL